MGFTHYWSDLELQKYPEGLISIFNQAYQDFLRSGVTIDGKHINLFSIFMNQDTDETSVELFNEHFHEWAAGASREPLLFGEDWAFCKTARKSYDVAVVLALHLASVVIGKDYSSDGGVVHTFTGLKMYIEEELDDSMVYNTEQLELLFDIWLNKAISFMAEHEDEMQKIEDDKQYSSVGDLPDTELEYIAEQIQKGNTTIYLNNGQVVRISFE